ncbi:MAG: glycosyltransferase family 4 protein [Vicinamibacterales bacterium]
MKTVPGPVTVVQVNYAFDKELIDPDQLLDRYHTLTGWSDALRRAGAGRVTVVQRFHRDFRIARNGVDYVFRRRAIAAAVAAGAPAVAHVNGLSFPVRTWVLRRALEASCALVVQNHGDGGPIGRAPWLRLGCVLTRTAADGVLFAADEHAQRWRTARLIGPHQPIYQVMVASTSLRPERRSEAREQTGISGSPAVLWVGRLNANKDPLVVLDGFERAARELTGATLTMIYSEDDLLAAVRERVESSPALHDRVRLVGAVAHRRMASFYSAADLFVVGSHHEGSGYALMEACACGAQPVVPGIPTFRLLTGGGSIGALWASGDAADCARALVAVARRDRDAERARITDHFARELSWDVVGRRALEIYQRVIERRTTNNERRRSNPA